MIHDPAALNSGLRLAGTWQRQALCATSETVDFLDPAHADEAVAICQRCPVIGACLAETRADKDLWKFGGIRAGLTPAERKRITAERKRGAA